MCNQEEEETSGNRPKSIKEMEEEKAAEKAAQQKWEWDLTNTQTKQTTKTN